MLESSLGSNRNILNLEPAEPLHNRTLNLPNLQFVPKNRILNLPNLLKTEPNLEPYLIGWQKMGDFFEVFPSKPNLEPTEPQKTERTSEPNQVRPNTNRYLYEIASDIGIVNDRIRI